MTSKLEEIGTDPRTADGYVVVWAHNAQYDIVLAVPVGTKRVKAFGKLRLAFESHPLYRGVRNYKNDQRTSANGSAIKAITEISFAVPFGDERPITLFLELARQCRVLENPIVSDMRSYELVK